MKWDDLVYVLAVARDGSYVAASKRLGVANTTVSRRLAALEDDLGASLFVREGQRLVPTEAADELIQLAERFDLELAEIGARVAGRDQRLSGPVRLTTVDLVLDMLTPAVARLTVQNPDLELSIGIDHEVASLARREADIAVRATVNPPDELVGRRLTRVSYGLFAAESLVLGGAARAGLEWPAVLLDPRLSARGSEKWLLENVPGVKVACRIDSSWGLVGLVAAGVGVGVLPRYTGRAAGLHEVQRLGPEYDTELWLLTHPSLKRMARVRAVMDAVADAVTSNADLLGERGD